MQPKICDRAATRHHWRVTSPAAPGQRLVFAALTVWRTVIMGGRFEISPHAEERMIKRGITREQLLAAVRDGRIIHSGQMFGDDVTGGYLAGDIMVVVSAFCPRGVDFVDLVPRVRTLFHTEPLDPSQPLSVPMRELAHLQIAK